MPDPYADFSTSVEPVNVTAPSLANAPMRTAGSDAYADFASPDNGGVAKANQPSPAMQRAAADAARRVASTPGLVRSVNNGFAFNMMPTVDAAGAALETGAHNLFSHITGQPDSGYGMGDAFNAVRQAEAGSSRQFAQQHPVQNIVGNVVGALANPINRAAGSYATQAPTLAQAAARSALTSSVLGAGYGSGGATSARGAVRGAVSGGATGLVVGAAAPLVAQGIGAGVRAARNTVSTVANGARALFSPVDETAPAVADDTANAAQRVLAQMRAKGMAPNALEAIDSLGKPITTAEAIGRPGVSQLGGLARRSGTTGDALEPLLRDRAMMAPQRMLQDFHEIAGVSPTTAAGDVEGLASKWEAEADPLFKAALNRPGPVWNSDLAELAQRPVIKAAMDHAIASLKNAGKDPTAYGFALDPDTGAAAFGSDLSKIGEHQPTAEAWDMIRKLTNKMIVRDELTKAPIMTGPVGITNGNITTAARDLTKALAGDPASGAEGAIPGYRAALDKSSDYLSLRDAFSRGQKFFLDPKTDEKALSKVYNALSEPEQEAFRGGFANRLYDLAQNRRLGPSTLATPRVQAKLAAVFDPAAAQQLVARAQMEARIAATGSRMMPGAGSPTFDFSNAALEQEGGPSPLAMGLRATKDPIGVLQQLIAAGKTVGTTPQVRNEMGRLYMQAPQVTAQELRSLIPQQTPRPFGLLTPPAASAVVAGQLAQKR
jgi:hypothetical protein